MSGLRRHIFELQMLSVCIALIILIVPGVPGEVARTALLGPDAIIVGSVAILLATVLWRFRSGRWLGGVETAIAVLVGYIWGTLLSRPDLPGDDIEPADHFLGASLVGVLGVARALTAVTMLNNRRSPSTNRRVEPGRGRHNRHLTRACAQAHSLIALEKLREGAGPGDRWTRGAT